MVVVSILSFAGGLKGAFHWHGRRERGPHLKSSSRHGLNFSALAQSLNSQKSDHSLTSNLIRFKLSDLLIVPMLPRSSQSRLAVLWVRSGIDMRAWGIL